MDELARFMGAHAPARQLGVEALLEDDRPALVAHALLVERHRQGAGVVGGQHRADGAPVPPPPLGGSHQLGADTTRRYAASAPSASTDNPARPRSRRSWCPAS